jgi:hypothetical protein
MSLWDEAGKFVWLVVSKNFSGFFSDLIGVSIGAYLGYKYGMRQEREIRVRETTDQRVQCLRMILHEIKEHKKNVFSTDMGIILEKSDDSSQPEVRISGPIFFTSCFDSAISSGLFSLLDLEIQLTMSYHYNRCKQFNLRYDRILDTPAYDLVKRRADALQEYLKVMKEPLEELIERIENTIQQRTNSD